MASLHVSTADFPNAARADPIKYHSTEARRLLEVTLRGLEGNGITTLGLGDKSGSKFILRGGLTLSGFARAQLPVQLGGTCAVAPVDMADRTVTFIDTAIGSAPSDFALLCGIWNNRCSSSNLSLANLNPKRPREYLQAHRYYVGRRRC